MLSSLRLVNYRCHQDTTIHFGSRMTLLLGGNQTGKSSIRLALEAALTNRNEMTNERGTGLRQQIRAGVLEAAIHVSDDLGHTASLELPVGTRSGDLARGSEAAVRGALRRGWFLALPAKEQRAYLQQTVGLAGTLTADDWRVELNGWTPEFPDLGDWWMETFNPQSTDRESLYKDAYSARTLANATIKRLEGELAVPLPEVAGGVDGDETSLRRKRDDAHEQIAQLRAEQATRDQKYSSEHAAWQAEVRRHEDAQRRVDDSQRRVESLANEAIRANGLCGKGSKSITSLRKKLKEHEAVLASARMDLKMVETELEALANAEGVCPAGRCQRAEMQRLTASLREARGNAEAAQGIVDQVRISIAESEKRDAEAEALQKQAASAGEAVQEALRAQSELGPMPAEPTALGDGGYASLIANRHEDLRVLDHHLQALQAAQVTIALRQAALDARGRVQTELEAVREEAARLSALVDAKVGALTDAGVIERRWRVDLAAFIGEVNGELGTFGLRLTVEEPWQIVVDNGAARVPVDQVSMSEYTWVSAAFQVAIARRTGVPMIALDEMGNLDGLRRRVFYQWAMGLGDVQVLLIAAAQDTDQGLLVRPSRVVQPGLAVYWCEYGSALLVSSGEEKVA